LVPGRKLILGGVEIPHALGLLGHSDADVLTHALMDAILGALALGDIGRHFPDTDPAYKNIDSLLLLGRVLDLVQQAHGRIHNADLTLLAQKPKLLPFMADMRRRLAQVLEVDPAQINIKATTTEGLGFVGREEGIAAYAVVLLEE
jgi:2-C-methyl-D-erythritol 2,4-cyclodiphosphate synthase